MSTNDEQLDREFFTLPQPTEDCKPIPECCLESHAEFIASLGPSVEFEPVEWLEGEE